MNENLTGNQSEFTANESDIRFNFEDEQKIKTDKKIKNPKKVKWYFMIPLVFLVCLVLIFVCWYLQPKKKMNVCLLNKTVLTVEKNNDINIDNIYRKHQGLFWLLEQQKYAFQNGSFYNYKSDYFGPQLDENGQISSEKKLTSLDFIPDLMYVSDVYGAVDDTYGYYNNSNAKGSGVTVDDMSVISYTYENGAAVVAEMELFNSNLDDSVYSQLASLCGVKPTGWVGRYVQELQDFTDVPDWAPPMYEKQEGVEWQFSGPGIILVSSEKIIILEQKTDFESKNLLKISINKEFKKEFGSCDTVNFYNWFEIVEPNYDSEAIATFEFDVNATGMEKLKGVLKSPRFTAITRKKTEGKSPVYYFAGDFNDYVSHQNYNRFLFANTVYRWISYDRQGDISNFYWNFYNPLMAKILGNIKTHELSSKQEQKTEKYRINENSFQINSSGNWQNLKLNAISINANEPGEKKYSRNYSFYQNLVEEILKLGANCVYAKDLLPPEFYRAIYANNSKSNSNIIYIVQSISEPEEVTDAAFKSKINTAINVLHGGGAVEETKKLEAATYFIDVSEYLLALVIDIDNVTQEYTYSGKYTSGTGTEGFAAYLYDAAQEYSKEKYGYFVPVGLSINPSNLKNTGFEGEKAYNYNSIITDRTCNNNYYFTSISFSNIMKLISVNAEKLSGKNDKYGYVFETINNATGKKMLLSGVGLSTSCGIYNIAPTTEKAQGQQIVSMLKSAEKAGVLCTVISDLNDDWSAVSEQMYPFTVPLENNYMWQNVADPAQTTGIVALDPDIPDKTGVDLADDDRIQMMSLSANEGYFYITAQLLTEIEYTNEQLFIGIDTYQRNDGEYYYSAEYTPTALSGMEFVIRFDDKQNAGLYVINSYNRSKGSYTTKESYKGKFDLVSKLVYGGFTSGDNQFYQTGSTMYIRIPWSWLSVTDPSQKIVLNNEGEINGQAKTVTTNGYIVSVLIADKQTKDQLYLFPENKKAPSYKTFKWDSWEKVSYKFREKESFTLIKNSFLSK